MFKVIYKGKYRTRQDGRQRRIESKVDIERRITEYKHIYQGNNKRG